MDQTFPRKLPGRDKILLLKIFKGVADYTIINCLYSHFNTFIIFIIIIF